MGCTMIGMLFIVIVQWWIIYDPKCVVNHPTLTLYFGMKKIEIDEME